MIEDLITSNRELFLSFNRIFFIKVFIFVTVSVINSIKDMKSRNVTSLMFIILTLISLICQLFFSFNTFFSSLIGVIVTLIVFLIIYFLSKGGIGQGDMFYLTFFASMFGYLITIIAFLLSFWIAAIVLIIPYFMGKIKRNTLIPFLPFMFVGCLSSLLITLTFFP